MATHTMTRPIAVRISDDLERGLTALGLVRRSAGEEARAAMSVYVARRMMSESLEAEIRRAERRFSRGARSLLTGDPADLSSLVSDSTPSTRSSGRQFSIRMDPVVQMQLMSLALIDDTSVTDQVRRAIETYVTEQLSDPETAAAVEAATARA